MLRATAFTPAMPSRSLGLIGYVVTGMYLPVVCYVAICHRHHASLVVIRISDAPDPAMPTNSSWQEKHTVTHSFGLPLLPILFLSPLSPVCPVLIGSSPILSCYEGRGF